MSDLKKTARLKAFDDIKAAADKSVGMRLVRRKMPAVSVTVSSQADGEEAPAEDDEDMKRLLEMYAAKKGE